MTRGFGVLADVTDAIIARDLPLHLAVQWTPKVLGHAWDHANGFEMIDMLWELRIQDARFIDLALVAAELAVEWLPEAQRDEARAGIALTRRVWMRRRESDVVRAMQPFMDFFHDAYCRVDPDSAVAYLWQALRQTATVVREPDRLRTAEDAQFAVYCALVGLRTLGSDNSVLVAAIHALGPPTLEQIYAASLLGVRR